MVSVVEAQLWYDAARKWFTLVPLVVAPITTFLIDAPFGRFTPRNASIFLVDGIRSWMVMELVLPATFLTAFFTAPLAPENAPRVSLASPNAFLAGLVLVHYFNRAILSPLRTPSRSQSHVVVPLAASLFNLINGSLMGSYLSSPAAVSQIADFYSAPRFYIGVGLWGLGFAGNIIHDEMLLNIRRKAKAKGKAKASNGNVPNREHYAIPHGLLYEYISYPNYFCEWLEWCGFAIASGPFPINLTTLPGLVQSAMDFIISIGTFNVSSIISYLTASPLRFFPELTPPWIFLAAEVVLMMPRAYRGHLWYKTKFPEYPPSRKIVIPLLL